MAASTAGIPFKAIEPKPVAAKQPDNEPGFKWYKPPAGIGQPPGGANLPGAPAGSAPASPPFTSAEQSAWALISQTLESYGFSGSDLTALENFVQQQLITGASSDQITLALEQTPQFAARFPAIIQREKQGLPPVSPAEYVSLENSYEQAAQQAGLPPNMASYDQLIAYDVSPAEYSARINQGYLAVATADPTVVKAFQDYYGTTKGQLAAYFLDPTKALQILQQQAVAAQLGGASAQSGFGEVSQQQAFRLAQMGVTYQQGQQGFKQLAQQSELTQGQLPGQAEQQFTTDQLLNATFGSDGKTQQALQRQADTEKNFFNQAAQFGQTNAGIAGLGVIQR